jgi:hypothetical protein
MPAERWQPDETTDWYSPCITEPTCEFTVIFGRFLDAKARGTMYKFCCCVYYWQWSELLYLWKERARITVVEVLPSVRISKVIWTNIPSCNTTADKPPYKISTLGYQVRTESLSKAQINEDLIQKMKTNSASCQVIFTTLSSIYSTYSTYSCVHELKIPRSLFFQVSSSLFSWLRCVVKL